MGLPLINCSMEQKYHLLSKADGRWTNFHFAHLTVQWLYTWDIVMSKKSGYDVTIKIHWKNFCATIYVLYHQFTLKLLDVLANLVVIFMIKYPLEHHLLHHMSKDFTYHKFNFLKPRNEWWKKKPVYRDRYGLAPVMSNSDSLTPKSVLSSKFMIQFQD